MHHMLLDSVVQEVFLNTFNFFCKYNLVLKNSDQVYVFIISEQFYVMKKNDDSLKLCFHWFCILMRFTKAIIASKTYIYIYIHDYVCYVEIIQR